MGRKIVVLRKDRPSPVLEETSAPEEKLQEALKLNPELLPVEELDVTGPLMIVGRETGVASGSVDLLGLGRGGEVVVIELKTGPQNSDFRAAAAQLLDYGAQLWGLSYDEFESSVALRYFGSGRCPKDSPVRGAVSLSAAARAAWPDLGDEELDVFQHGLAGQLEKGSFRFVLAAQRFTTTMERTLRYLNAQLVAARFYGVELIRFSGEELAILEARTVLRPEGGGSGPRQTLDEQAFLERVEDAEYREALRAFLLSCKGLGLKLAWGTSSVSVRVTLPQTGTLETVVRIFPPGFSGVKGLTDVTVGFFTSKATDPGVRQAFEGYTEAVVQLPGAEPVAKGELKGSRFAPSAARGALPRVVDAVMALTRALEAA